MTVSNTGGSPLTISGLTPAGAGISVASPPTLPVVVPAGASTNLSLAFAPSLSGAVSGSLVIATDDPAHPTLTVALTGTGILPQAASVTPTSYDFGAVPIGGSTSTTVTVSNTGGSPLTISGLTPAGAGISVASPPTLPVVVPAGASTNLSLAFAPSLSGAVSGSLVIATDDPAHPTLTVALTGTGVLPQAASVTPTSYDFGAVGVGKTTHSTFIVSNTGGSPLLIAALTPSGTGMSIGSPTSVPVVVPVGGSTAITVAFAPTIPGAVSGSLVIATDDRAHPTLTVALTGVGVDAVSGPALWTAPSPAPAAPVATTRPVLGVSIDDPAGFVGWPYYGIRVDGQAQTAVTIAITDATHWTLYYQPGPTRALGAGVHTVWFQALNKAGKWSTIQWSFVVAP